MASHASNVLPIVSGYIIKSRIAEGGLSEVFQASGGEGKVALKVLLSRLVADADAHRRMAHECAIGLKIPPHANVVRTFKLGTSGTRPFIVLEYFPSRTLRSILVRRGKPLPVPEAAAIAHQVVSGLHHIHTARVIHQDIKPENVLINEKDEMKLIDFGISSSKTTLSLPWWRKAQGSPSYMSPEQIRRKHVDERADIYGFGCLLYEMVTGNPPYAADTQNELLKMHVSGSVKPPRPAELGKVDQALDEMIMNCLETRPEKRPPAIASLATTLHRLAKR